METGMDTDMDVDMVVVNIGKDRIRIWNTEWHLSVIVNPDPDLNLNQSRFKTLGAI
jgi:hypothetical protein